MGGVEVESEKVEKRRVYEGSCTKLGMSRWRSFRLLIDLARGKESRSTRSRRRNDHVLTKAQGKKEY